MKIWKLIKSIGTFFYNSKKSDLRDFPEKRVYTNFYRIGKRREIKGNICKGLGS